MGLRGNSRGGDDHTFERELVVRYALLSDVHANLPALRAVLESIAGESHIDATYHLGDLVGYAPWPNECVELLREAGVAGVAGNYDSTVAVDYKHCGCKSENAAQEALSHVSYEWTRRHTSIEVKGQLGGLPFRIDLRPGGGHVSGPTVVLVHGTPTLNAVYWTEDRSDDFSAKMAGHAGLAPGDVICFGHTHKPWHRQAGGIHFINAGSVGRPKDGDWRAGYVLLDVGSPGEQDVAAVTFRRVEYDLDEAMRGIRQARLPEEFAEFLRLGGVAP